MLVWWVPRTGLLRLMVQKPAHTGLLESLAFATLQAALAADQNCFGVILESSNPKRILGFLIEYPCGRKPVRGLILLKRGLRLGP